MPVSGDGLGWGGRSERRGSGWRKHYMMTSWTSPARAVFLAGLQRSTRVDARVRRLCCTFYYLLLVRLPLVLLVWPPRGMAARVAARLLGTVRCWAHTSLMTRVNRLSDRRKGKLPTGRMRRSTGSYSPCHAQGAARTAATQLKRRGGTGASIPSKDFSSVP